MSSGAMSTLSSRCRNSAHGTVDMPIIRVSASLGHWPPCDSTKSRRTSAHTDSEAIRTPSRSKITARIAIPSYRRPARRSRHRWSTVGAYASGLPEPSGRRGARMTLG